jgi:hypothetical protein
MEYRVAVSLVIAGEDLDWKARPGTKPRLCLGFVPGTAQKIKIQLVIGAFKKRRQRVSAQRKG